MNTDQAGCVYFCKQAKYSKPVCSVYSSLKPIVQRKSGGGEPEPSGKTVLAINPGGLGAGPRFVSCTHVLLVNSAPTCTYSCKVAFTFASDLYYFFDVVIKLSIGIFKRKYMLGAIINGISLSCVFCNKIARLSEFYLIYVGKKEFFNFVGYFFFF